MSTRRPARDSWRELPGRPNLADGADFLALQSGLDAGARACRRADERAAEDLEPAELHLVARAELADTMLATARSAALGRRMARQGPSGTPGVVTAVAAAARWATSSNLARRASTSPVFDEAWYLDQYPEVRDGRLSPQWHYRRHGRRAGFSPHPLFDSAWYRTQAALGPDDDPVEHYLEAGADAGLDPHPVFSTTWYRRTQGVPEAANPLVHYLEHWRAGRSPHPLFDAAWYRRANPDVDAAGVEPLQHFLEVGWLDGRDPRPSFDVRWYLFHSADVAADGENPLVHYLQHGWRQGRDPHRLFETAWYRRRYLADTPDVEPLAHYLEVGALAGADPGGIFSTTWYRDRHRDLPPGANPLEHYLEHGARRREAPSAWADQLLDGREPELEVLEPAPLPPEHVPAQ